jgi:hypothetical protein
MEDIRGQQRKRIEHLVVLLSIVVGVTSVGLLVGEMGKSAELAYKLQDLEATRTEALREADRLAAEIDRLRSLDSVHARQIFLGMVKPTNIEFWQAPVDGLALR